MPHTTTKKSRVKRADTRPNSTVRKVAAKLKYKNESIQDIRVTRKQKDEKNEREVPKHEMKNDSGKSSAEKVVRALRKKLTAIEQLIEKQNNGEVLDQQQINKINNLQLVMSELEKFA